MRNQKAKIMWARIVLAVFFAFCYSIAYTLFGPMAKLQDFNFNKSQIFPFIVCFTFSTVVNSVVFCTFPKWNFNIKNERLSRFWNKVDNRKLFLCIWLFIFVSWIPAYLIMYPGVLSYDILSQTLSALGEISSNHHPVLHTWLIRVFLNLGDRVFSSYEHGLGILSFIQMIFLSYSLTRLVILLKKKSVPALIVLGTVFCSAFWYTNACLSVSMIKDTLHAAFLVLFVCHFTEIVLNASEYISKKQNYILLPIISFFMFATRNNGIHIYLFCFVGLMFLRILQIKKIKKYILLIFIIVLPIVAFKIYSGPFFEKMGIQQGEVREALSIPIQQLQRVAVIRGNELTTEQADLMNYYITDLSWRDWDPGRKYDPFISDPAKSCFFSPFYEEDPLKFWQFYLETGLQFTKEYIKAFLSNTLGYWYPGYYGYSYVPYENYSPDLFVVPLQRKSIIDIEFLKTYYESVCSSDFWRNIPIVRMFFVQGFALWLLCYSLILAWVKRKNFIKILPIFLPLIGQFGIMLLSPMSSFRYSWPFYLMLPITFIVLLANTEADTKTDVEA